MIPLAMIPLVMIPPETVPPETVSLGAMPDTFGTAGQALRRATHRTIAAITEALTRSPSMSRWPASMNSSTQSPRPIAPTTGPACVGPPRGNGDAGETDLTDDAAPGGGAARTASPRRDQPGGGVSLA